MQEMLYPDQLPGNRRPGKACALDHRRPLLEGAPRASIGHVSPEAAEGGGHSVEYRRSHRHRHPAADHPARRRGRGAGRAAARPWRPRANASPAERKRARLFRPARSMRAADHQRRPRGRARRQPGRIAVAAIQRSSWFASKTGTHAPDGSGCGSAAPSSPARRTVSVFGCAEMGIHNDVERSGSAVQRLLRIRVLGAMQTPIPAPPDRRARARPARPRLRGHRLHRRGLSRQLRPLFKRGRSGLPARGRRPSRRPAGPPGPGRLRHRAHGARLQAGRAHRRRPGRAHHLRRPRAAALHLPANHPRRGAGLRGHKVEAACIDLAGRPRKPPAGMLETLRPYFACACKTTFTFFR